MHLRHLRWEASPEPHPFIVPARIRAPESITPSVSDCFLLQTSFVVFVCIDYIMSSGKSQVFLMKSFPDFTGCRPVPRSSPNMQQILHQSAGSRCLEAHRHTALLLLPKLPHCALIWLPYPAPGGKQISRAGSTPKTQDLTPAAAEMTDAIQELSFHRASEICFRLSVRGW